MAYKLIIVGIGPGSKDYILPEAIKAIECAKVLAGGKRALAEFACENQQCIFIDANLSAVIEQIREKILNSDVVVMVSGDPGFHSMLVRLKQDFSNEQIIIIPGISSLQIAFARLNLAWQDANFLSMHGKEHSEDTLHYFEGKKLGLLTDGNNTPAVIAQKLLVAGWPKSANCYVCSNLSYDDEKIDGFTLGEMLKAGSYNNCVVVVIG